MQRRRRFVPFVPLLLAACGQAPERIQEGHPAARGAQGAPKVLFSGEVRLAPELADDAAASLFISARPAGMRMPVLSRKLQVGTFERATDGGSVARWELTEADKMGGLEMPVPERLELKFTYDPDGLVETFDGVEAVIVPVEPGQDRYSVDLHAGMPTPDEPPSALQGAPSGATLPPGHPPTGGR